MKIIIGLLMLCIIIVVHELGHFLVAKACHIEVKEFWVGFGPKIVAFEKGGTRYVLRAIPVGGACVFANEELDTDEDEANRDNKEQETSEVADEVADENIKYDKKGHRIIPLNEASVWARMATLFAGPFFNFLLAFLMGIVVVTFTYLPSATITGVTEGGPAKEAGIMEGDRIVKLNGSNVYLYNEVSLGIQTGVGKPLSIVYERDGKKYKAEVIPEMNEEYGTYMIGVTFGDEEDLQKTFVKSLKDSVLYERFMIKMTFSSLKMLFNGQAAITDMSGPVGVASIVSSEYDAAAKISPLAILVSMLNIAVLISANLGVMNLLPLPALDGGRIIFCIYEIITGRKADEKVEGFVHLVGSLLLILLTVFIFFNDILRLIGLR